jgi:hypothetical protein
VAVLLPTHLVTGRVLYARARLAKMAASQRETDGSKK